MKRRHAFLGTPDGARRAGAGILLAVGLLLAASAVVLLSMHSEAPADGHESAFDLSFLASAFVVAERVLLAFGLAFCGISIWTLATRSELAPWVGAVAAMVGAALGLYSGTLVTAFPLTGAAVLLLRAALARTRSTARA